MIDIAEKLRQAYHNDLTDCPILLDGADEIDRLKGVLGRITAYGTVAGMHEQDRAERLRDIARAALEAKP